MEVIISVHPSTAPRRSPLDLVVVDQGSGDRDPAFAAKVRGNAEEDLRVDGSLARRRAGHQELRSTLC